VGGIKYKMNVVGLKDETQPPHGLRSALTHPTNNCASLIN